MKTLILEIQNGGLGDHLFYSHLPRIAKETKAYEKVLISNHSRFRNDDYKKLVWDSNPYIDGFTNKKGIFHLPDEIEEGENLLDSIMLQYQLDDGKRFHEPEVYYHPPVNNIFHDKIIYDPNYISYTGDLSGSQLIENWFVNNKVEVSLQMKKLNHRYLEIEGIQTCETASLLDFCSLIVSCKRMYCLTTGTATLAAALGVSVTVFYGSGHLRKYRHSALHQYVALGSDYSFKDKVKKTIILFLERFIQIGTR